MTTRALAALLAAVCSVLLVWLAAHHPLSPTVALAAGAALAGLSLARPALWPFVLLALLPWVGLTPWTGWFTVEELDLAVLAVAAGGYLRLAVRAPVPREGMRPGALRPVLWLLPLAVSTGLGIAHGIDGAGGLAWGWWQGFREPMNSLRLGKSVFEVLLLLPLWQAARGAGEERPAQALHGGMLALLTGVFLWVAWERLAFTGLTNFSTDYRVTGPFWEMHVGGAALDAALAMALPFALVALMGAGTPRSAALWAVLLAAGLYASLVTFSRVVLAAVPLALAVAGALRWRQGRLRGVRTPVPTAAHAAGGPGLAPAFVLASCFALLAAWTFPTAGYRGLLALLGGVVLLLPLGAALRPLPGELRWPALGLGAAAMALVAVGALLWPRGAYVLYVLAWGVGAAALFGGALLGPLRPVRRAQLALGAFMALLAAIPAVAERWGGWPALPAAAVAAIALAAALAWSGRRADPAWPESWRWQVQAVAGAVAICVGVGVIGGGGYLRQRLSASAEDSTGRVDHWGRALALLDGADWVLGKGVGRYAATRAFSGDAQDMTGDYRLLSLPDANQALALSSGQRPEGWSQVLRFSQRVDEPAPGPLTLHLSYRTDATLTLGAEVCEKHLLYIEACALGPLVTAPTAGAWRAAEVQLRVAADRRPPQRGAWFAPRLIVFSVAVGTEGRRVELDRLRLTDASGRELLRNGDFERGLAHWFFSSDFKQAPWHAQNLAVHLLYEQGALGLAAFVLAWLAALWRVALGAAARHALAPALAGALLAIVVVGMVDSLFDMPRITFLSLLLVAVALALPGGTPRSMPRSGRSRHHRRRDAAAAAPAAAA